MSEIGVSLGAAKHQLTPSEAGILRSLLSGKRSLAAVVLARSVRQATNSTTPQPIRLGVDDVAALRGVLAVTNVGGFPGLEGLQTALRDEDKPLN